MMPAATMTTMTNTAPIAVTQPKSIQDPTKMGMMINNNRQGRNLQYTNFLFSTATVSIQKTRTNIDVIS